MITVEMLDNAIEIAKEEIMNPDTPTKSDIRDFKRRLNPLLDKLEEDADEEVDPDDDDTDYEMGEDSDDGEDK